MILLVKPSKDVVATSCARKRLMGLWLRCCNVAFIKIHAQLAETAPMESTR
jgi:hypothetical protein